MRSPPHLPQDRHQPVGDDGEHGARQQFDQHGVQPEVDSVEQLVVAARQVAEVHVVEGDVLVVLDHAGGAHAEHQVLGYADERGQDGRQADGEGAALVGAQRRTLVGEPGHKHHDSCIKSMYIHISNHQLFYPKNNFEN